MAAGGAETSTDVEVTSSTKVELLATTIGITGGGYTGSGFTGDGQTGGGHSGGGLRVDGVAGGRGGSSCEALARRPAHTRRTGNTDLVTPAIPTDP